MLAIRPFTPLVAFALLLTFLITEKDLNAASGPHAASVTILCYMNGDNDLGQEVLHALDMMESVGSSGAVNVIALVDSHPRWLAPYEADWSRARLVHVQTDPQIGRITSPIIEEWGEADLGNPQTLERFVRTARALSGQTHHFLHLCPRSRRHRHPLLRFAAAASQNRLLF
jgi:hypothetical protein